MTDDHTCNSIVIDSTHCISQLCLLCAEFGADKTVLCGGDGHRHPYTVPYSLLFEPMRNKPIKFLELGVYQGRSMFAWRCYFKNAKLYGYDNDVESLKRIPEITSMNVRNVDVSKEDILVDALKKDTADGELFDVILDDADHNINSQLLLMKTALPFLKQGGLLILEDVYRERPETLYESGLKYAIERELISFYTFITCDHKDRYSPEWENDKLLVMVRS